MKSYSVCPFTMPNKCTKFDKYPCKSFLFNLFPIWTHAQQRCYIPFTQKLREGIITNIQTHIKLLTLLTHRNVFLSRYFRSGWLITLTQKFRLITRIQSWLWHWFNEIIICNSINGLERHMHFLFVILQRCAIYDKYI